MNRSEQIDKALKDILKDVECARANKQCDIDYFLSSIEKCANATLSLPRRNCDVGTAEEQVKRHNEWCDRNTCVFLFSCRVCFAKWSQMPYETKEGSAK